jgi:hypothetical protein
LPLQPILDALPPDLKAKLRHAAVGDLTIPVPLAKVMSQLPQGIVRIPFGELRLAAPGVFVLATDCDQRMVTLPLSEILPRVHPAKLVRRNDQKTVEVPEDITSPFGAKGQGLALSRPRAAPSATARPSAIPMPPPRAVTPAPPIKPAMPPPPSCWAIPEAPLKPATLPPPRPTAPALASAAPTAAKVIVGSGYDVRPPPNRPGMERPAGVAKAPAGDCLQVPLSALMAAWPPAVRLELSQMSLTDATVALPIAMVEKGLRQGKVSFPWKLVRAWIRPTLPPQVSANDGATLDLPLSVLAPLFVARRPPAAHNQRRVAIDETIPNLFFGFPQPDAGPGVSNAAPVSAPAPAKTPDTNFYAWSDHDDSQPRLERPEEVKAKPSGTDFVKRCATPNEIVSRAAALDGVAGAVVALPDGLAVASRVPPEINGDTLAAFLPQIFSRVSQCTKELRMGELNNLNFTVGNVPWKIFRVHAVYFAAFGRVGEPLPTAQLAALATELDHKPKAA